MVWLRLHQPSTINHQLSTINDLSFSVYGVFFLIEGGSSLFGEAGHAGVFVFLVVGDDDVGFVTGSGGDDVCLGRFAAGESLGFAVPLFLLYFDDGIGDLVGDELDGADGVVVAGNDVVDLVRIAVGIDDGDDGYLQL